MRVRGVTCADLQKVMRVLLCLCASGPACVGWAAVEPPGWTVEAGWNRVLYYHPAYQEQRLEEDPFSERTFLFLNREQLVNWGGVWKGAASARWDLNRDLFEEREGAPPLYPEVQVVSISRNVVYRGHALEEFPARGGPTDRSLSKLTLAFAPLDVELSRLQIRSSQDGTGFDSENRLSVGTGPVEVVGGIVDWERGHAIQRRIEMTLGPQIIRVIHILPTVVAESWIEQLDRGMVSTYFRGFEFDLFVEESIPFQIDAPIVRERLADSGPIRCHETSIGPINSTTENSNRSGAGSMDPRGRFLARVRPARCSRAGEENSNPSWRDAFQGLVETLLPEFRYLERSENRLPLDFDLGLSGFEADEERVRRYIERHRFFYRFFEPTTKRLFVPKVRGRKRFRVRVVDR